MNSAKLLTHDESRACNESSFVCKRTLSPQSRAGLLAGLKYESNNAQNWLEKLSRLCEQSHTHTIS